MPTATLASPAEPAGFALPAPVSPVFLPKEHGSWSFALEPLALGLLVAPSVPGASLGVAAVAAFFLRRPLRSTLLPASDGARAGARAATALLALISAAGLLQAVAVAGPGPLWPLLLALPFGLLFSRRDLQRDSRSATAELAGAAAFGFLPAALATLAGWDAPAALALAAIMLARSLPTILVVRTLVRRRKGLAAGHGSPLAASIAAFVAMAALAETGLVPFAAVPLAALLLLRAACALLLAPPLSPRLIGIAESVLGIVLIAAIAAAYRFA